MHRICILSFALVLACVQAGLAQGWDPNTDPSLAAWWPFDEGAGNVAGDASGNGNDGTFVGDPQWVPGRVGGALEFNGDDYLNCGNGPSLQIRDQITIAFWFSVEAFQNTWEAFMAKGDDSYRTSRGDGSGNATHMGASGTSVGGGNGWFNGTVIVTGGDWHHMAAVYDGSEGRIYVDGVLDVTSPGTGQINQSTYDFWIGNNSQNTDRLLHGLLDDVRIYSRALTVDEIKTLIPPKLKAHDPEPADGTLGWITPLVQWTKGDTAVVSNVYFGTDPENLPQVGVNQTHDFYYHVAGLEPGVTYYWRVDAVEVDMVTIHTGDLWSFTVTPNTAWSPIPADGATRELPGVNLQWSPGNAAMNHRVYFGMDKAAVMAGDASADQGVLTEAQLNTGALRASTTYYWRVDENALGGTVHEGQVWSFTTFDGGPASKILYETWQGIGGTAIADLTNDEDYPGNPTTREYVDLFQSPVDWADNYGQRLWGWLTPPETGDYTFWIAGDDNQELWLSPDVNPASAVRIADVPGWTPAFDWDNTGGGSSSAAAQVSDPVPLVAGEKYFIMALGKEGGGGDSTAVAWQGPGVETRTVISADYVDAFALAPLTAFGPTPSNGAVDVFQSPLLTWNAGENATQHAVYFGDDPDAVAVADESSPLYKGTQSATSYNPGALEWDKTFAWRIDEIAGGETVRGPVWVFTTAGFIPIDDFETYTNEVGSRIFQYWIDGLGFTEPPPGNPGNGSAAYVGHDIWTVGTPYTQIVETSTVQNGNQSMPLYVNNSTSPFYSETDHTFAQAIDMTSNGVTDLSLWVHGAPIRFEQTGPDSVTMSGGGADIWDVADEFRFAYKSLSGDGSITVKVDSFDNLNAWTKVGVMIRETLDGDSKNAMVAVTGNNGAQFTYRLFAGDISEDRNAEARVAGITAPVYLKLTRTGNTFQGQYSDNGVTWNNFVDGNGAVIAQDVTMVANVYIGLAVLSHVSGSAAVAEYSEIATTRATGQWQVEDVGIAQPGNTRDQFYVGLASGASPVVVDLGEGPVLSDEWVEVKIPLTDFAGVNLGSVRQMIIGVGDRDNPVATGDSLVFIDNIRGLRPEPEPAVEE